MYGVRRRACKHKMASGNNKRGTNSKKAVLSDNTRLMQAIEDRNILAVKEFLENKNLKPSKLSFNFALQRAAEEGQKLIVQLLLNHSVYVSGIGKAGSLALVAAAEGGYVDIVKLLINKGVPVDSKNALGKTALMVAVAESCCSDLVKYLLTDCKADINLQDGKGKTVLMLAVEIWDYETVQLFFMSEDHDCDELVKDSSGLTAMDYAERNGSLQLLTVLSESRKKSMSPLSLAAGRNNLDLVRQLIQIYPSCVETIDVGMSPLLAAMVGLDQKDGEWDGKIYCSLELMEVLLQAGVDVDDDYSMELTPLMLAASAGADKIVKMLLWHGASVNHLSHEGPCFDTARLKRRTALMIAAEKGFVRIVEMLIEAGAALLQNNHEGENAFGIAIKHGHKACIQMFLKHWKVLNDYDVDLLEENKALDILIYVKDRWHQLFGDAAQIYDIFCKAIKARCYQLVTALNDHGVDINCWSPSTCPLFLALSDINMLRLVLDLGADINTRRSPSSFTALMQAVVDGNVKIINMLLKYRADMYAESNGSTALTLAGIKNNTEAVIALLEGGMDVNHVTETRLTGLWCALTAKNFAMTEALIKFGANVNFAGSNGVTMLMHAIKHCTSNFSELLIKHGAHVNAQDDNGDTTLFHALRHSITREEKVSLLLQHGADINHINLSTKTPLMVAARFCHANILKVLLTHKPNVNGQDINGDTALHVAVLCCDCQEKLSALVSHGANLNMVNADYESPLMIAVRNLDAKITKYLLSLGANLDFKNSPYASHMWRTDLDNLLRRCSTYPSCLDRDCVALMNCVEALLEAGCLLHGAQASNLDKFLGLCINGDRPNIVKLLLQSGVGPNLLELSCVPESFPVNFVIDAVTICSSNVSPLCTAILIGRPKVIALFVEACFYNDRDIKMLQNLKIKLRLEELFFDWPAGKFSSIPVEEICPRNWSLRTWSKLAVQKAVGYGQGREQRVRALPIPVGLQDELLFKKISLMTDSADEDSQNTASPSSSMGLDDRD